MSDPLDEIMSDSSRMMTELQVAMLMPPGDSPTLTIDRSLLEMLVRQMVFYRSLNASLIKKLAKHNLLIKD